jgi:hypothetical protein
MPGKRFAAERLARRPKCRCESEHVIPSSTGLLSREKTCSFRM